MAVDGDDAGEVFDGEAVDRFAQKVGEGDELAFLHGVSVQRARPADRGEVDGAVPHDRLADGVAALALADHAAQTEV